MTSTRLYCKPGCALCLGLLTRLTASAMEAAVSDVTVDPGTFEAVVDLGYRSPLVLVAPDGISAAGQAATELGARLARHEPVITPARVRAHGRHDRKDFSSC